MGHPDSGQCPLYLHGLPHHLGKEVRKKNGTLFGIPRSLLYPFFFPRISNGVVPMKVPLLPLASLALCLGSLGAQVPNLNFFSARLTGDQQSPPVTTKAVGWAVVDLNPKTRVVRIYLASRGVVGKAAHLHSGFPGKAGPVVLPLKGGPSIYTGTGTLSAKQVGTLMGGGLYLNLHSAAHPGGEIRGQVLVPRSKRFVATLDGKQEVPPNNSKATGEAIAFFHEPDNVLVYAVRTKGLNQVVAAHVHRGPLGKSGPVVFPLRGSNGLYCGVSPRMQASDILALAQDGLYFNVHTSQIKPGEIRGQIRAQLAFTAFTGRLNGAQQSPPVKTKALGQACIVLQPDGTLSYKVSTSGLKGVAAHIHKGLQGQNGPVVFPLSGGPTVYQGTTKKLTKAQLQDLLLGRYYVNVHTATNPGGEIRAQLTGAFYPPSFGEGCPGSNGLRAYIEGSGIPCVGSDLRLRLSQAKAKTGAVLLLGTQRDKAIGLPLPLDLGLLGAKSCFLLNDFGLLPTLSTLTDSLGCADLRIPLPFLPSLRDQVLYGQFLILDPGVNSAGFVTTNGTKLTLR